MALLDVRDVDHDRCTALLKGAEELRVVPAPVLVELDDFVPSEAFTRFLDDVRRGAFLIEDLHAIDYVRVEELVLGYSDMRIGFVDAAVLAVVERLKEPKLATLDHRHFSVMRPRHADAVDLLPTR